MKHSESQRRLCEKLYHDLGDTIVDCLENKKIHEIMLNPDGQLWVDSRDVGLMSIAHLLPAQAFSIIHAVAGLHNFVITANNPQIEAELPFFQSMQGQRFIAQIPPMVAAPSFTIRKRSESVFTLDDYLQSGRITQEQVSVLRDLIGKRKNILICGGPGSGKTTLINALILEIVRQDNSQRLLILEDLPELQCTAPNRVSMLTTSTVNMTALVRMAMRMRPDRILIGEVRGAEALDMLKAWNTGCPGGLCTVHANAAEEAIQRILDLAMENRLTAPPLQLVAHTIDAVVSINRKGHQKGFIHEILTLGSYQNEQFTFKRLA
ncbi:MAG: P-type conjugative transfer ATPase TrbB [Candidatus Aquirickettsiella sp.]